MFQAINAEDRIAPREDGHTKTDRKIERNFFPVLLFFSIF